MTVLQEQVVEQMREVMKSEGITQTELARRLGCSEAWVSRTLNGENMTFKTAEAFMTGLHRSPHLTLVRS